MPLLIVQVPTLLVQVCLSMRVSKRGTTLKSGYCTNISLPSMETVADRHRHAAYHNKHRWQAF